ncbi:ATP-dependent helicase HrpB [Paenibacillus pini]|uniref:ATP-dependent helicase HrpB n=1 Tax=Paenibacillus pini JCM 16418 TaxID=1236976 RepID=W7YA27_9BACL|nr:ATP-dependent helicase HrpB [Paenibacillus pini]GAF07895.1 ATP-dependent helicase HrpB [Paenibacillus pini JCM 16418]
MTSLPILKVLPEVIQTLQKRTAAVLIAEPGAGKTTQVPLAFLNESWLEHKKIIMLEPRRLAVRSAAQFMASSLGEKVGETVGYRVHMDTKISRHTRIEVVTEGILTRMLQSDPELAEVGLIIFDEFHERNLHADLGLALALESQSVLREDMRILIMSATLDAEPVAALLQNAPIIQCPGRQFPVETVYVPRHSDVPLEKATAAVIRQGLTEFPGDMLVFLPGVREIRQVRQEIERGGIPQGCVLRELYGQLPQSRQDEAIRPDPAGNRKIILSTSIAESSLTIDGVQIVVDSGLMRTQVFSARTGMPYLTTVPVSKASADQRKGRAGRTTKGAAYRLWSRTEHDFLRDRNTPEIIQTDLAPLALELATWGVKDPQQLKWLDCPPDAAYTRANGLLHELGALDRGGAITIEGKKMASIGMHPRLARMVLQGMAMGRSQLACMLAVLIQERDPFHKGTPGRDVDIETRMLQWINWLRNDADINQALLADESQLRRMLRESRHMEKSLGIQPDSEMDVKQCGLLLSYAYPDRIGQGRGNGKFLLTSGRRVELLQLQQLSRSSFIVAAVVDDRGAEGRVLLAAELTEAQLYAAHVKDMEEVMQVSWDRDLQGVKARKQFKLGGIILKDSPYPNPPAEAVSTALLEGITVEGLQLLPWSKSSIQLRQRLQYMHVLNSEWPDVSDEALLATLGDWLLPYISGMRTKNDLQRLRMIDVLENRLSWEQRKQLDREVPTHLSVPSGSKIPIDYSSPEHPALAVRLQEMFGLLDTPCIGNGKIPITLHLLSPAQRPVQVTSDLASFWRTGYFEVRKDLKGRYPKHYWPDQPLEAVPTRRTRPQ